MANQMTYAEVVDLIEDNNEANDASWQDWQDASHVLDCYDIELSDLDFELLNTHIAHYKQ
jgi:hypothetical protein